MHGRHRAIRSRRLPPPILLALLLWACTPGLVAASDSASKDATIAPGAGRKDLTVMVLRCQPDSASVRSLHHSNLRLDLSLHQLPAGSAVRFSCADMGTATLRLLPPAPGETRNRALLRSTVVRDADDSKRVGWFEVEVRIFIE
ncbi:MAG: hypothetical protein L0212_11950 [Acidobacteria bacterium]|nr:hypothetical protein [Acidobacteriota bacterium]